MSEASIQDLRYLKIVKDMSEWECTQAFVLHHPQYGIYYSGHGVDSVEKMIEKLMKIYGTTMYCFYLPHKDNIAKIEEMGCKRIMCLYKAEDEKKHKLKRIARELIASKDQAEAEAIQAENEGKNPDDLYIYRAAIFHDHVLGHTEVLLCDMNDQMEHSPGFDEYIGEEIAVRKINIPSEYEKRKFIAKNLGSLVVKYRVAIVRTEQGGINLVLVTNARQHQEVSGNLYFVKWLKPWIEVKA